MSLTFFLLPVFSKKMSHYFATKPERGWMEQLWSWNQKAIFHQLSGTGMGCSLCDFLWTLISSDKSNRLNCSNEQTVPTSPPDTKVFVGVRQCHVWCKHLIPQMLSVCASVPILITLWPCSGVWLTLGHSPVCHSCGSAGMWVALPRWMLAALQVRAALTPALLPALLSLLVELQDLHWEWQQQGFPGTAGSAWWQSCPEGCSWGRGTGTATIRAVPRLPVGVTVMAQSVSWAGSCSLSGWFWFSEIQSTPRDLYICAAGKWFCISCVMNSNAEWSTVQFTCSCEIYTVLALIMVLVSLSGPDTCWKKHRKLVLLIKLVFTKC